MKKIYILTLLSVSVLFSCKKSSPAASHITCTIDGTAKTFNGGVTATRTVDNGITTISISGINAADNQSSFTISVDNRPGGVTIYPGTFSDSTVDFGITGLYATSQYFLAGRQVKQDADIDGVIIANHMKLEITVLDNTSIKGTFSGDFFNSTDMSSKKTITNGDFYAKFQ